MKRCTPEFVNREDLLEQLGQTIEQLRARNRPTHFLLEIYGIPGIGKTSILEKTTRCASAQVPCALTSLRAEQNTTEDEQRSLLLKSMAEQVGVSFQDTDKQSATFSEPALQEATNQFLAHVQSHGALLLFDDADEAPAGLFEWLQASIILPLLAVDGIAFVFGTRRRLSWQAYELRRVASSVELGPFSREATAEQLTLLGRPDIVDQVHRLTFGIPLANEVVVEVLDRLEREQAVPVSEGNFRDYEVRLVSSLVDEYIQRELLDRQDRDTRGLLRYLCVFRQFNTDTLNELAPYLITAVPAQDWGDLNTRFSQVERLVNQGLATWNAAVMAYTLTSDAVRKILSLQLYLTDPATYIDLSEAAARFYEQKLFRRPNERLVNEWLYHKADVLRLKYRKYDVEIAKVLMKELLATLSGVKLDAASKLEFAGNVRQLLCEDSELSERLGDRESGDRKSPNILVDAVDQFIERETHARRASLTILKYTGTDQYNVQFEISGIGRAPTSLGEDIQIPQDMVEQIKEKASSVESPEDVDRLGKMIRTRFLGIRFQEQLRELVCPLLIRVTDAEIPWELMHDGTDFTFLRIPVGKCIVTTELAKVNPPLHRDYIRPLLVGVPETQVKGFHRISKVEIEIESLARALGEVDGIEFTDEDKLLGKQATRRAFLERLSSGDYDIIHFAGHALVGRGQEENQHREEGLVLYDEIVASKFIKQGTEGRPLVFLSTCESGKDKTVEMSTVYLGSYTYGIASSFIVGGAPACVGSLWSVGDKPAAHFARTFYERLVNGETVGEALKQARIESKREFDKLLVWASYVLYGDPVLRLYPGGMR